MSEFVASIYAATGKNYYSTTSHPSMIRHRSRSPRWRLIRRPSFGGRHALWQTAWSRLTASFVYCGPQRPQEARLFGIKIPRAPIVNANERTKAKAALHSGDSQSVVDAQVGATQAA
jgi:hypothetical protein